MELSELNNHIKNIPDEQKEGTLALIDIKTNENMKEVIQEIRRLEDKFDAKFEAVDSKFSTIFWILGIMATIILAILGLLLKSH